MFTHRTVQCQFEITIFWAAAGRAGTLGTFPPRPAERIRPSHPPGRPSQPQCREAPPHHGPDECLPELRLVSEGPAAREPGRDPRAAEAGETRRPVPRGGCNVRQRLL